MDFMQGMIGVFKKYYPQEIPILYDDSLRVISSKRIHLDDLEYLIANDNRLLEYFFCMSDIDLRYPCRFGFNGAHIDYKGIRFCRASTEYGWFAERVRKLRLRLREGLDKELLFGFQWIVNDLRHHNNLVDMKRKAKFIDDFEDSLRCMMS